MLGFRDVFSLWSVVLAAVMWGFAIRRLTPAGCPVVFLNQ